MGLATIDPHSQKEHTEIHKIPKFGVNQASFDWDTAVWKCQNLQRNVWPSGRCVGQRPNAIHFFVNFDFFKSLYLTEKRDISDHEVSIDFPLLVFISKGNVSVEIVGNDLWMRESWRKCKILIAFLRV